MTRKGPDDLSDKTVVRPSSAPRDDSGANADDPGTGASGSATVFDPNGGALPAAPPSPSETVFQPAFPAAPEPGHANRTQVRVARPSPPSVDRRIAASGLSSAAPVTDIQIRYGTSNAILAAAAPLLTMLGRLRLQPAQQETLALARQAAAAIDAFETKAMKADTISAQDADAAKYVLCELADDIIGSLPGQSDWGRHSMLARFFGSQNRGTGFFATLNQVLTAPEQRCDLLELMHTCLSLGFQGQYRDLKGDQGALQRVRDDAYETLRYFRPRPAPEMSPHWQASLSAHPESRRRIPLWGIAAAAFAMVVATFFGLRTAVTANSDKAASELLALNPATPVTIERSEVVPVIEAQKPEPAPKPAPPTKPAEPSRMDRIQAALDEDSKAGRLSVGTKGDFILIEINNKVLFEPGSIKPAKEFEPVAAHIAAALDAEAGPIRIVGHTDSVKPGKSSAYKSNFDLSVARAKAIASLLASHLKDASRLTVEGKGEDEPVADNATAEGRAKNRRIDIMIARDADAVADQAASKP